MDESGLRLELSDEAAEAIAASGLLGEGARRTTRRRIHFDTPARTLAKAGLHLSIERAGRRRIQTVQAGAGGTAPTRWEQAVAGKAPVLDGTTPIDGLLGKAAGDLAPVMAVEVTRWTGRVEEGTARIRVTLERGTAVAQDMRTPFATILLQRTAGPPAALFALARRLDAVAPVRLGVLSALERGALLSAPFGGAHKAGPVGLSPVMTAAAAFEAIVQTCLRQFRLNEDLLRARREAAALHQARVALRRLRSAFSLFRPLLGADPRAAALREGLRTLAGELGEARNLDVLLARSAPGPLQDLLRAEREAAHDRLQAVLNAPPARALIRDLAEWLALGEWRSDPATAALRGQSARDFAVTTLDRARRKVRRGGRRLDRLTDEARHEVRKDAKKLRYAAEFFAALFTRKREARRARRFIAALEAVQEGLGALNDLATAPEVLADLDLEPLDPAGRAAAAGLLGHADRAPLIAAAAAAHDDFRDARRFWR